jgi:hypothetical protein
MPLNGGDSLAKGAHSAQFGPGASPKTQVQWDLAFLTEDEFLTKYPGTTRARYQELFDQYNQGHA